MSVGAAQIAFWGYSALMGLSLAPVFLLYTDVSIARVFLISAATFAATSLYGYSTRRDLAQSWLAQCENSAAQQNDDEKASASRSK